MATSSFDLLDDDPGSTFAPKSRVNPHQPPLRAAEAARRARLAMAPGPGVLNIESVRPKTPLSDAALLTNSASEPSLAAELRAEIDTSDEVDLLCAFVKWHGLRLLEDELGRLRRRRAPLRVITTTYMGSTERSALDRLVRELGAEVRIRYDAARTRLHAKAWMFRRRQTRYAYLPGRQPARLPHRLIHDHRLPPADPSHFVRLP